MTTSDETQTLPIDEKGQKNKKKLSEVQPRNNKIAGGIITNKKSR